MDEPIIAIDPADVADSTDEAPVEETTEESSPKEETATDKPEVTEEESKEASEEEPETTEEETDGEKAEETEEAPKKDAESRKQALNTEIRELVTKRNELRQQVEQANSQAYRTQPVAELVDQGMEETAAELEALQQQVQMQEYNNYVSDLNATLNTEALQVMSDFPVFDPESSEYNETLANEARQVYLEAAKPQTDPKTGLLVQANASPYKIYQSFARVHQSGSQSGELSGQVAAEKNLAAADTPSSTAPKRAKVDPFKAGLLRGYEGKL